MVQIGELSASMTPLNINQMTRWVNTKVGNIGQPLKTIARLEPRITRNTWQTRANYASKAWQVRPSKIGCVARKSMPARLSAWCVAPQSSQSQSSSLRLLGPLGPFQLVAEVRVLLLSAGEAGERPEDTFRKRGGWIGMDRGYRGLDGVRAKLDIGKNFDIWNQN